MKLNSNAVNFDKTGKLRFVVTDMKKNQLEELFSKVDGGGEVVEDLPLINGHVVEVNPAVLKDIFKNVPETANFTYDQKVQWIPSSDKLASSDSKNNGQVGVKLDVAGATLRLSELWSRGFNGKDVTIAVIDTGIAPHEDFDNIVAFKDLVRGKDNKPYDDQGHGTHCASDAAGTGKASGGKYKGPAYGAKLVSIKVLDGRGSGSFSTVIKGIQYAVDKKKAFNEGKADGIDIRVISMSLGSWASKPYKQDPVALAVEKAYEAGIVVCVAAGNDGPGKGTIGSPAIAPHALTVGAMDDKDTVNRADDDIADFSSRGPTIDKLKKPNIITPGKNIWAALSPDSELDRISKSGRIPRTPDGKYISISGTSMATPIMAGIVAILLQANPKLTPADVADIVSRSGMALAAHPEYDENTIGKGLISPIRALDLALAKKAEDDANSGAEKLAS